MYPIFCIALWVMEHMYHAWRVQMLISQLTVVDNFFFFLWPLPRGLSARKCMCMLWMSRCNKKTERSQWRGKWIGVRVCSSARRDKRDRVLMMGEAWDTLFKGVQACWHGNGCREPIPLIYCHGRSYYRGRRGSRLVCFCPDHGYISQKTAGQDHFGHFWSLRLVWF